MARLGTQLRRPGLSQRRIRDRRIGQASAHRRAPRPSPTVGRRPGEPGPIITCDPTVCWMLRQRGSAEADLLTPRPGGTADRLASNGGYRGRRGPH